MKTSSFTHTTFESVQNQCPGNSSTKSDGKLPQMPNSFAPIQTKLLYDSLRPLSSQYVYGCSPCPVIFKLHHSCSFALMLFPSLCMSQVRVKIVLEKAKSLWRKGSLL